MAKIALIGSDGFLGRHVRSALAGHRVLSIGRSASNESGFLRLDVVAASPATIAAALSEFAPEAVINCAGATAGTARELTESNVLAVAALVDAIANVNPATRLVQIGSAAEYGRRAIGERATEDSEARPTTLYGATKLAATELVLAATTAGKVDGVVLRLFNPVGAGMPESTLPGRAAILFRDAIQAGAEQVVFGPLTASRDFVDARDAADAIVAAALVVAPTERLVNCGSGDATSTRALVASLAEVAGYSGAIIENGTGSPRSEDVPWQVADTRRAEHALKWTARRPLPEALRRLWEASGPPDLRLT